MTQPLAKTYDAAGIEDEITRRWQDQNAFHAEPDADGRPYVIVIPPPNVTAALHLGHALNNTLQDVLIRRRRMCGDNAVWFPGTDHAGIATQTVVEKRVLQEQGKRRTEFEREDFVKLIQAWKDEYEARITQQLKAMGCSCDWARQAFTMDDIRAKAVRAAFYQLFRDGLIYRGKRLVNWDPATQTALADDEVEMQEVDGNFWYMQYPLTEPVCLNGEQIEHITVATTRPETMLGDTAVAMNPDDPRAGALVGQQVMLPIVNRRIPIIADDYVVMPDADGDDPKAKFATGFLKVTPAHDPNDWEIGLRHELPVINVMAPDGSISADYGWREIETDLGQAEAFLGMDRDTARQAVVRWFKDHNLMQEIRPYRHTVGHSYRSHVPIEPYLSDQWYVKVTDEKLAGAALRAMAKDQRSASEGCCWKQGDSFETQGKDWEGGLRFTPHRYAKLFQTWHENLRDWCISRQLWWGHRIPVWMRVLDETHQKEEFQAVANLIARFDDEQHVVVRAEGLITQNDIGFGDKGVEGFDEPVMCYVCLLWDDQAVIDELESCGFARDTDVLDTWFSSGLWPMSTMGWPEKTPELAAWNPTSVLSTAREIITLWVSRMVMFNLYFRDCLPFEDVFIHAMIQDGEGQKMSKSLGNGVDPLDIIASHGADAMRYTLVQMTTQTQDVRMPVDVVCPYTQQTMKPKMITTPAGHVVAGPVQEATDGSGRKFVTSYGAAGGEAIPTDDMPLARNTSSRFDLGRNFANKLWNAARFAFGNLEHVDRDPAPATDDLSTSDRWVLSRLAVTTCQVNEALDGYQFSVYAHAIYDFFWRDLCDWYLEAIKPVVKTDTPAGAGARRTLAACLDATVRLMHPAMPFITEKLFEHLNALCADRSIPGVTLPPAELCINAAWPTVDPALTDDQATGKFELMQQIVGAVRELRNTYKVHPKRILDAYCKTDAQTNSLIHQTKDLIRSLGLVNIHLINDEKPNTTVLVLENIKLFVDVNVDTDAELKRLTKQRDDLLKNRQGLEKRLANPGYTQKAPAHLVQQTRDQLASVEQELKAIEASIAELQ